jgi:hypothetical protein
MNQDPRNQNPSGSGVRAGLGWWAFTLLACAGFALRFVWRQGSFLDLPRYAAFQEVMPYQGRVLMAWVLHATAADPRIAAALMRYAFLLPTPVRDPYLLVLMVVDFLALLVTIWTGRLTLQRLTGDATFSAWAAALLILYMTYFNLVIGYGVFMMPYDLVSLAIFMAAVWLVLSERYLAVFPLLVAGTLNRETAIFIPAFLALYTLFRVPATPPDKLKRLWAAVPHIFAQLAAWYLVRLWVNHLCRNNALEGNMHNRWVIVHIVQNLESLAKPPQWPLFLSLFGFALPLFVVKFKSIGDRPLALACASIMGLWAAVSMFIGVIVEIRIFNELTVFLMPCIALILWNQWVLPATRYRQLAAQ